MERNVALSRMQPFVLPFEVSGAHSACIVMGDMDNDLFGDNELAVGGLDGNLSVFKGDPRLGAELGVQTEPTSSSAAPASASAPFETPSKDPDAADGCARPTPWRIATDLGTLACLCVGDLYNNGRNVLVAVAAEGLCHIFDVEAAAGAGIPHGSLMRPALSLRIARNVSAACIEDVQGDGRACLVLGTRERSLQVLQLRDKQRLELVRAPAQLPSAVSTLSVTRLRSSSSEHAEPILLVGMDAGVLAFDSKGHCVVDRMEGQSAKEGEGDVVAQPHANESGGAPANLHMHVLGGLTATGQVSQAADEDASEQSRGSEVEEKIDGSSKEGGVDCGCGPRKRAAGKVDGVDLNECFAIADSMGHVTLQHSTSERLHEVLQGHQPEAEKEPSIQSGQQFAVSSCVLALSALDVTGDGVHELVACTWDGMVYMAQTALALSSPSTVGQRQPQRVTCCYRSGHRVCAFAAGNYSLSPGCALPSFAMTTFSDELVLLHDVRLLPSCFQPSTASPGVIMDDDLRRRLARLQVLGQEQELSQQRGGKDAVGGENADSRLLDALLRLDTRRLQAKVEELRAEVGAIQ